MEIIMCFMSAVLNAATSHMGLITLEMWLVLSRNWNFNLNYFKLLQVASGHHMGQCTFDVFAYPYLVLFLLVNCLKIFVEDEA